jgi:hypothetical protein
LTTTADIIAAIRALDVQGRATLLATLLAELLMQPRQLPMVAPTEDELTVACMWLAGPECSRGASVWTRRLRSKIQGARAPAALHSKQMGMLQNSQRPKVD